MQRAVRHSGYPTLGRRSTTTDAEAQMPVNPSQMMRRSHAGMPVFGGPTA